MLRKAYARAPFDGEGAYRYGGRWWSPGTRLCYTSQYQSLSMLEYFVHLDKDDPPDDLVLAVAEIPSDVSRTRLRADRLPANWRVSAAPPELARIGDEFVRRGRHCLLMVPSVLAPSESNCLINPAHADFPEDCGSWNRTSPVRPAHVSQAGETDTPPMTQFVRKVYEERTRDNYRLEQRALAERPATSARNSKGRS